MKAELRSHARAYAACANDCTAKKLRDAARAFSTVVNSINLGLNSRGGS